MDTSVFIARIIGPSYIIIAIGMMFNPKFYQRAMEEYSKSAALVFFGGLMALCIGFLIVLSHNVWTAGWAVIITLFGWGGIIKGTWLFIFPDSLAKLTHAYQKNKILLVVHSIVAFTLGMCLTVFGYFV